MLYTSVTKYKEIYPLTDDPINLVSFVSSILPILL